MYADDEGVLHYVSSDRDSEDYYTESDLEGFDFVGYAVTISNTSGYELPATGSSGATPFDLIGVVFAACGALLYLGYRVVCGA